MLTFKSSKSPLLILSRGKMKEHMADTVSVDTWAPWIIFLPVKFGDLHQKCDKNSDVAVLRFAFVFSTHGDQIRQLNTPARKLGSLGLKVWRPVLKRS